MWWSNRSPLELAAIFAIGGSVLAAAVPSFFRNLSASKLTEPIEGLDRLSRQALVHSATHPQEIAFPPSAPLTPAQVPRGVRVTDPPETWEHLTWRALDFRFKEAHAFSFRFDSERDPVTGLIRFTATAHGDLDGDGALSTFEVRGERALGAEARISPGMYIDREVE